MKIQVPTVRRWLLLVTDRPFSIWDIAEWDMQVVDFVSQHDELRRPLEGL